ncbi:hypothetical protein L5G32_05995 [Gordonia sp. HY002]|uniref:MSCRAMM family protein n=1 Tax=Gordonia zhenghanii TaxID=2911516 RepID=UPI001EF059C0|nr:SpaA isopeptide-forming pilin-related protein [Gordonia zhenghanii]MCF8569814.1 hypothetical protein [Gordonia zhenghanii]MCF8602502.1 hypothetical protein [Gordonia zhenghanii]
MIRTLHRILLAVAAVVIALVAAAALTSPPTSAEPDTTTPAESTTSETTPAPPTTTPPTTKTPSTTSPSTPPSSTTPSEAGLGTVTVQAIDLKTNIPVSGVGVDLTSGDVVKTVNTSASVEMPAGVVSATITAIPDGYDFDRSWIDPSSVNLPVGGTVSFVVSLGREGQVGAVSITKRDAVTGALLPGARYRISTAHSDQSLILSTSPSGTGAVHLAPGGYTIQEVGAPAGYLLDSTVRFVAVNPSQTRHLELYDSPIEQPVIVRDPNGRVPLTSIPTGRTH